MKSLLLTFTILASGLVQTIHAQPVVPAPDSFYRLRFSFNTRSDWAALETSDPRVLSSRQISTQGTPSVYVMSTNQILMGQPTPSARAGSVVGVLVDYAIDPVDLATRPIVFNIRGGEVGNSWAAIWNMSSSGLEFFQLGDTLNLPRASGVSTFALNTVGLAKLPPIKLAAWQTPALKKMAWAFYYPWYPYIDNWNSSWLKDWPSTLYSSGDPTAIQRHITQAQGAGVDGFISSWAGPGTWTDTFFRPILDSAQGKSFAIAPYLEILDASGQPQSPATLVSWLTYLLSTYSSHPAFYKVGGRPVVFIWATHTVPLATWRSIFDQVRAKGYDAAYLSMGVNTNDLTVFDGMHTYGFQGDDAKTVFPALRAQVKYYHLLADVWAPVRAKIWAPGLAPGYDETSIPGRAGTVRSRNNGGYYQSQWDTLNAVNPDWTTITSWNEEYENTHIEPSRAYGTLYLQLTNSNVARWKNQ